MNEDRKVLVAKAVEYLEKIQNSTLEFKVKQTLRLKLLAFTANARFLSGENFTVKHYDINQKVSVKEYSDKSLQSELENIGNLLSKKGAL